MRACWTLVLPAVGLGARWGLVVIGNSRKGAVCDIS